MAAIGDSSRREMKNSTFPETFLFPKLKPEANAVQYRGE